MGTRREISVKLDQELLAVKNDVIFFYIAYMLPRGSVEGGGREEKRMRWEGGKEEKEMGGRRRRWEGGKEDEVGGRKRGEGDG